MYSLSHGHCRRSVGAKIPIHAAPTELGRASGAVVTINMPLLMELAVCVAEDACKVQRGRAHSDTVVSAVTDKHYKKMQGASDSGQGCSKVQLVEGNPAALKPEGRNQRSENGLIRVLDMEFAQRGQEPGEIFLRGKQRQVHIFAKLRRAVKHAGLAAHKQRLDRHRISPRSGDLRPTRHPPLDDVRRLVERRLRKAVGRGACPRIRRSFEPLEVDERKNRGGVKKPGIVGLKSHAIADVAPGQRQGERAPKLAAKEHAEQHAGGHASEGQQEAIGHHRAEAFHEDEIAEAHP
jgi:hypothetical protein